MQQYSHQPPKHTDSTRSAEERLRESVLLSTSAFREMQQRGAADAASKATERPQTSPPTSRPGPRHPSQAPSPAAAQEEQALHAMEQMLRKKEAHLEGERAKLAAWAAELQRREAQLQAAAAPAAPADNGRMSAALQQPGPAAASSARPSASSSSATQDTAASEAGEFTEEFEPGVFLTFGQGDPAGKRTLRRIRFSRALFTAESAKQVRLRPVRDAQEQCCAGTFVTDAACLLPDAVVRRAQVLPGAAQHPSCSAAGPPAGRSSSSNNDALCAC